MSEAAYIVQSRTKLRPRVGVVLGSGLGQFAAALQHATHIPYESLPGFPEATAEGHAGELVLGTLGANGSGAEVAVMSGRYHLYEGYSAQQVTCGIRLFHELGVRRLILSNAAGGIHSDYEPGLLVLISDHINLQGSNPLTGPNDSTFGSRFPDMTEAYSLKLREVAFETARDLGIKLSQGVYAAMLGPSYETPAEIRFLRAIGADLVGMSTVAEAIAANHRGMEVLGISCVTNIAAGLRDEKLNHADVLEVGKRASGDFIRLLSALVPKLAHA
jgi:purine-nucleoside phosphorylase